MDPCKTSILRKLNLKDKKDDKSFTVNGKDFWDLNLIGEPHLYVDIDCLVLGK